MIEIIAKDNPWLYEPEWTIGGVERNAFKFLVANKDDFSVLVIKGPIFAGKTFLLKQYANYLIQKDVDKESVLYFDLLRDEVLSFVNDKDDFFYELNDYIKNRTGKIYLLFDEVQLIKTLDIIQELSLSDRYKIVIASSYETAEMKVFAESMEGRTTTSVLYPFSFREYLFSKTDDVRITQKIHSLEAFMRYLIMDPDEIFTKLKEFRASNGDVFDFIRQHFNDYVLYGGYPEMVFRDHGKNAFEIMTTIINKSIAATHQDMPVPIRALLENIARKKIDHTDSDTGDNLAELLNSFLIYAVNIFNPMMHVDSAGPSRFILTDHGLRNILIGTDTIDDVLNDMPSLLNNFLASQMLKFMYFDEIRNKQFYYIDQQDSPAYNFVFCDTLNDVYPIGFVTEDVLNDDITVVDTHFERGFVFTTSEMKVLASRARRIYLIPFEFLAGI